MDVYLKVMPELDKFRSDMTAEEQYTYKIIESDAKKDNRRPENNDKCIGTDVALGA